MPNIEQQIAKVLKVCEDTLSVAQQILNQLLAPPAYLVVKWSIQGKELNMPITLVPGQTAQGLWSAVDSAGNPDPTAVLSNPSFTTSDATVFSVVVDPANPTNGCVVTALSPAVMPDSAVCGESATATPPGGTPVVITGTDTVQVNAAPPPPPPPPASLVVTWTAGPVPAAFHKK